MKKFLSDTEDSFLVVECGKPRTIARANSVLHFRSISGRCLGPRNPEIKLAGKKKQMKRLAVAYDFREDRGELLKDALVGLEDIIIVTSDFQHVKEARDIVVANADNKNSRIKITVYLYSEDTNKNNESKVAGDRELKKRNAPDSDLYKKAHARQNFPEKLKNGKLQKKCVKCGSKAEDLDHIIPVSLGGQNIAENAQWLCDPCYVKKGTEDREILKSCYARFSSL